MSSNQSLLTTTAQGVRPLRGRVLISIAKEFEDEVKVGGATLYLDTTYKPLHHVQEFGTVVAPPINMPEWVNYPCEVRAGDRVRFLYLSICDHNLVVIDGKRYWLVPHEQLYYIERPDGAVQMLNNYCLVEPVLTGGGEEKTAAGLITNLDATQAPRPVANWGALRYATERRRIPLGSTVAYEDNSDLTMHVGDETLYLMDYHRDLRVYI